MVVADERQQQGAVVVGGEVLGDDAYHTVVVFQCIVEAVEFVAHLGTQQEHLIVHATNVAVNLREPIVDGTRQERVGFFILLMRRRPLPLELPRSRISLVAHDDGVYPCEGEQRVMALLEGNLRLEHVCLVVLWAYAYELVHAQVCAVGLVEFQIAQRAIEERRLVGRSLTQRATVVADGTAIVLDMHTAESSQLIDVNDEGVQLYAPRAVLDSTAVVLEHELGISPVVVCAAMRRARLYRLSKIMYCRHVIVHTQRLASHINDAIHANLRTHRSGEAQQQYADYVSYVFNAFGVES